MRRETVQRRHHSPVAYVESEVPFSISPDHTFANVLVAAAAVEDPLLSILERIDCGSWCG